MFKTAIVNSGSFGKLYKLHLERLQTLGEVEFLNINSGSEIEIISKLKLFDAVVASTNPNYTASILENLPNLKILARHGTGFSNVDLNAANNLKIYITRTPGTAAATAVAEYTFGLILAALRNFFAGFDYVRENRWKERSNLIGSEFANKTLGIIGFGNIGRKLAEYAKCFGANVIFYDHKDIGKVESARQVDLKTLVSTADIISLHCGLNEITRNIINEELLLHFKLNAILINTARGELVNHHAVAEALSESRLGYYLTDVVADEPINNQHVLIGTRNCIVLPHLGGYSREFLNIMGETCVTCIEHIAKDMAPPATLTVSNF